MLAPEKITLTQPNGWMAALNQRFKGEAYLHGRLDPAIQISLIRTSCPNPHCFYLQAIQETPNQLRFIQAKTEGKRLSASGVIIDQDNQQIVLDKRSATIATYPNYYHSVGGNIELSDQNLRETMIRELYEETGLTITPQAIAPERYLIEELSTGYVQVFYFIKKTVTQLCASTEGTPFTLNMDEIDSFVAQHKTRMTPTLLIQLACLHHHDISH